MAKKGDLKPMMYLNIGFDAELAKALEVSAARHERRMTEEARFAIREYLGIYRTPAEATADVST